MGSIFELGSHYNELFDMLTDEDCDSEVVETTLEAVVGEIEEKGENYIAVCNKLDMEIDACRKQVEYWNRELKIRENGLKRLKDRLKSFLAMIGKTEIPTGNHVIKVVKNGGAIPLNYYIDGMKVDPKHLDMSVIPNEYKKVVVSESLNTDKIREALNNGVKLDFVEYGERGYHLKIK